MKNKDCKLSNKLDYHISGRGLMPGIFDHNPISTVQGVILLCPLEEMRAASLSNYFRRIFLFYFRNISFSSTSKVST